MLLLAEDRHGHFGGDRSRSDAVAGDAFGGSVDVDGEYVVVGARKKYANTDRSEGSVYVYKKDITVYESSEYYPDS